MSAEPIRSCIVCRKKATKENFIKIVKNKDGSFGVELDKKLDGRGAYICKCADCIEKCEKTKALNRAFKQSVPACVYEELKNGI